MLDVLQRPDLDQLMENISMPDEMKALLRDKTGAYTLEATSYPAKVQTVSNGTARNGGDHQDDLDWSCDRRRPGFPLVDRVPHDVVGVAWW